MNATDAIKIIQRIDIETRALALQRAELEQSLATASPVQVGEDIVLREGYKDEQRALVTKIIPRVYRYSFDKEDRLEVRALLTIYNKDGNLGKRTTERAYKLQID